jgi:hypothetical protein
MVGVVRRSMHGALVVVGPLVLSLGLLSLSSCNVFDPRSDALACSLPTDCDAPRVCESGYCVIPAVLLPDADPLAPDSSVIDASLAADGSTLPDADPATCNPSNLLDDFADGLPGPLWIEVPIAGVAISEAGGVLTFSAPTNPAVTGTAGYRSSQDNHVLTDRSFFVEIPTMVDTAGNAEAKLVITSGVADNLQLRQKRGTLSVTLTVGGTPSTLASIPYNPVNHRWWRVSDSAGNFRVQTSPDGMQWTDQVTGATPGFFGGVAVELQLRAFNQGIAPGELVFDNANGGGVVPACP